MNNNYKYYQIYHEMLLLLDLVKSIDNFKDINRLQNVYANLSIAIENFRECFSVLKEMESVMVPGWWEEKTLEQQLTMVHEDLERIMEALEDYRVDVEDGYMVEFNMFKSKILCAYVDCSMLLMPVILNDIKETLNV